MSTKPVGIATEDRPCWDCGGVRTQNGRIRKLYGATHLGVPDPVCGECFGMISRNRARVRRRMRDLLPKVPERGRKTCSFCRHTNQGNAKLPRKFYDIDLFGQVLPCCATCRRGMRNEEGRPLPKDFDAAVAEERQSLRIPKGYGEPMVVPEPPIPLDTSEARAIIRAWGPTSWPEQPERIMKLPRVVLSLVGTL